MAGLGGLTIVRFQPDTWLETLLRPVAMAAPDANVYVEIMAPDFRFVFVLALLALLAAMSVRALRRRPAGVDGTADRETSRPVFVLLAALAIAFVPWLAITANGRYFVAGLLIVGPVCGGLTRLLPVTRALRLTLAVGMVALQAFAVQQSAPWQAWTMAPWKESPYFHVEVPPQWRSQPATYVTMSAISYSLLAPMFHPQSRWLSLHNAPPPSSSAPDGRRTDAFLSKAQPGRLMLLVPVVPGMLTQERLPNARVSEVLNEQLASYRLGFTQPQSCRFLSSRGLAGMGLGTKTQEERERSGFWLCQLTRLDAGASTKTSRGKRYDAVFKALEGQCPRFFPPGGDGASLALANGEVRSYLQAEMKAYVYDSGEVYYKYYRALNPVLVGNVDDLMGGRSRLDCGRIRGRSGLPWDREI
jgi:hypothetical protein